tara:strand:+ start:2236 stop:3117 length:882 start_codon:yes stop_codon:yes gene_type:complete
MINVITKCKIIIVILLIYFIILKLRFVYVNNYVNGEVKNELDSIFSKIDDSLPESDNTIPKILFQTYFDKDRIPEKVTQNIETYAKDYKRFLFDDNDALLFLYENFGCVFVEKFKKLSLGAHKADLLRYCFLYVYGGVYIDIKTELFVDLSSVIDHNKNRLYTVTCYYNDWRLNLSEFSLHQGFIAVPPKNFIIKELIYKFMYIHSFFINLPFRFNYLTFCKQFYQLVSKYTNVKYLKSSVYDTNHHDFTIELFKEVNNCSSGQKRNVYFWCIEIQDKNNNLLMNCRYPDFPW